MSDRIDVNPTPIQRNRRDVAIELVNLYIEKGCHSGEEITEDKIAGLYERYHQLAVNCDHQKLK